MHVPMHINRYAADGAPNQLPLELARTVPAMSAILADVGLCAWTGTFEIFLRNSLCYSPTRQLNRLVVQLSQSSGGSFIRICEIVDGKLITELVPPV